MSRDKATTDREQALKEFILQFKKENVSYEDFIKYLDEVYKPELVEIKKPEKPEEIVIPASVFDNDYLSALEAVVKYLHENKDMRFSEVAGLLNRDQRAVGTTYRFARKKMKPVLRAPVVKYFLPLSIIADRRLSVLESIVYYLRKTYALSYHDIALLMRRNDRTVWTVYQRALKKLKSL